MDQHPATIAGHIAYRTPSGEEAGRERFELIRHEGGHVLRAWCEVDDEALTRDVSLAMDGDWRPTAAFLRLTRSARTIATLLFTVSDGEISLHGTRDGKAIEERRLPLGGPLAYLGLHPLQGDALIVTQRGVDRPGVFLPVEAVTNSVSPNGDADADLVRVTIDVAYLGEETIEVTAGRFDARRYALQWRADWPPADVWVRRDDPLFLKMVWAEVPTWYELSAWEEQP